MFNIGHAWAGTAACATSGCDWRAAFEADAIGESKLKRTNQGAAVEVDAIGELQPKPMQLGSS